MKLRLLNNTIRVRFQQRELHQLLENGSVSSSTRLGPRAADFLTYQLQSNAQVGSLDLRFNDNLLVISLSPEAIDALAGTDLVGVNEALTMADGVVVSVVVEKDFKCLAPRAGEEDAYPHPDENEYSNC